MRTEPTKAWATKHPRTGILMTFTIATLRRDAIAWHLNNYSPTHRPTWRQLYRRGWRCVRVTIKEE